MKAIVLSMMGVAGLAACAVSDPVSDPEAVGETSQAIIYPNDIFYDKFDSLALGSIHGQAGWVGSNGGANSCIVVPGVNSYNGDKNLDCSYDGSQNGQGAFHTFSRIPGRNYHFQFDTWMSGVNEATHGKVFIEELPGNGSQTRFQFAIGCSGNHTGIRVTFEYGGPGATLLTDRDCTGHYRVACIWHDGGTQLRCGASRLPEDPREDQFAVINLPEAIGTFSLVRVLGGIGFRQGTTTFDKVQVLSD
jgi:hypothetical protein